MKRGGKAIEALRRLPITSRSFNGILQVTKILWLMILQRQAAQTMVKDISEPHHTCLWYGCLTFSKDCRLSSAGCTNQLTHAENNHSGMLLQLVIQVLHEQLVPAQWITGLSLLLCCYICISVSLTHST